MKNLWKRFRGLPYYINNKEDIDFNMSEDEMKNGLLRAHKRVKAFPGVTPYFWLSDKQKRSAFR